MFGKTVSHSIPDTEEQQPGFPRWAVAMLVLFFLINTVVLLWGLNRGFDFNDEGFAVQCFRWAADYPLWSSFHLIVSKLTQGLCPTLYTYRILGLLVKTLSTAVFL